MGGAAEVVEVIGTPIINIGAEIPVFSGYELCDFSGFKLYPGESRRDYRGHSARPRSFDREPYREFLRYLTVKQSNARFSEREDVFVSTSTVQEDL